MMTRWRCEARPEREAERLRKRRWSGSSAAMESVRPWPRAAEVQMMRSGQAAHFSGLNRATWPRVMGIDCPAGQVAVLGRKAVIEALFAQKDFIGEALRGLVTRAGRSAHPAPGY